MGFGIYSLLEAALLVMNAIAILHEERFLCKYGLGRDAGNKWIFTSLLYGLF